MNTYKQASDQEDRNVIANRNAVKDYLVGDMDGARYWVSMDLGFMGSFEQWEAWFLTTETARKIQ